MSLVLMLPVTDGQKKRALRHFLESPGPAKVAKITTVPTGLGRNVWVKYQKRLAGLDDKTWLCAAAPSTPAALPMLVPHPDTSTRPFHASAHPADSQKGGPLPGAPHSRARMAGTSPNSRCPST